MATSRKPARKATSRKPSGGGNAEKYEQITDRFVAALEKGTVPWREPWTTASGAPRSMSTGKAYRGINIWLLALENLEKGYSSPYWGTYNQIAERAGMVKNALGRWESPDGTPRGVRAGEKGTQITFWKEFIRSEANEATGERETKRIPMLRMFTVFNADQAAALPAKFHPQAGDVQPIASAQEVLDEYFARDGAPALVHDLHGAAHFNHGTDTVHMTSMAEHESAERYYSTAFHEGIHSTGHHTRLGRRAAGELQAFGCEKYAKEELVAEMGAAILCAETGVETAETFEMSAAYFRDWAAAIKEDPRMVVSAASAAQKATDLILEGQRVAQPEEEPETEHDGQALGQAETEREAA